jgi:RNA polymerase sigma factor (sigma-70 family)
MTTTQSTSFPWNLVTKNLHGHELLRKKLHEKITKLEKHLKHFPPGTVHLQIVLERHPRKPLHTAALNLRVPSNIVCSEKSAPDVIKAFDDAVKALLREAESFKADLRREPLWKRKERRTRLRELKAASFATEPMAEGTGPQKLEDVIREFFQQHYTRLVRHARRHIRHDELAGDIPKGALDACDIVDEVARQAVAKAGRKPEKLNWLFWFYHLIHEELRRQRRVFKQKRIEEFSLDETKILPEDAEKAGGYDAEQPLDIIERELEPPVVRAEGLVPDPRAVPPDKIVAQKDLLEQLQHDLRNWPRPEREVFELYFVEGLEPEEIAIVTRQPLTTVRENIASIQRRLREEMLALV